MFVQFSAIAPLLGSLALAATKSTTKSSGSSTIFFVLLILVVVAYLWIRPQRRRMREQQTAQRNFEVGDEVVTTSGIVGRVVANDGTRIDLEIAPGTTIQILPQAVGRRMDPGTEPPPHVHVDGDEHHDERHEHADDVSDSKWWPTDSDKGFGEEAPGGSS